MRRILLVVLALTCISFAKGQNNHENKDEKIVEISKIVRLSKQQEKNIKKACVEYEALLDSALYEVSDPSKAAEIKYNASKVFHNTLMEILSERQRIRYIQVTSTPEIRAKTAYKLSLLEEKGDYSTSELAEMEKQIFDYLMMEKVVYVRDKYDIRKQKENISRLKNVSPKGLRESNILEKQKGQGVFKNGTIKW